MNINRLNAANFGGAKTLKIIDVKKINTSPAPDVNGFIVLGDINYQSGYSDADFHTYNFKNGDLNYLINNVPDGGDNLEECIVYGIFPKDQSSTLQHLLSLEGAQYIGVIHLLNDYDTGETAKLVIGTVNCPAVIVRGKRTSGTEIATLNHCDFNLIVKKKAPTLFAID